MKKIIWITMVALLFMGVPAVAYAQDAPDKKAVPAKEEVKKAEPVVAPAPVEPAKKDEAKKDEAKKDEAKADIAKEPAKEPVKKDEAKEAAKPEEKKAKTGELTDEEAAKAPGLIVEAIKTGQWTLLSGLVICFLLWVVRKFGMLDWVKTKETIPSLAIIVASLGYVGAALSANLPVTEALLQGGTAGLAAIGGWEIVFKRLLKRFLPTPEPTPEPAEEEAKEE